MMLVRRPATLLTATGYHAVVIRVRADHPADHYRLAAGSWVGDGIVDTSLTHARMTALTRAQDMSARLPAIFATLTRLILTP